MILFVGAPKIEKSIPKGVVVHEVEREGYEEDPRDERNLSHGVESRFGGELKEKWRRMKENKRKKEEEL